MKSKALVIALILCLGMITVPLIEDAEGATFTYDMSLKKDFWNFKSYPNQTDTYSSVLYTKISYCTALVGKNSTTDYWYTYWPSYGLLENFLIEPGDGLFILVSQDTIWNVTINMGGNYTRGDLWVDGNLSVSGNSNMDYNLTVNGSMTIDGNFTVNKLTVTGNLTTNGNLTVDDDLTVGGNLNVTQNAIIGGDLTVTGTLSYTNLEATNDVWIGNNLAVGGDCTIDGDLTVNGTMGYTNFEATNDVWIGNNLAVGNNISVNGDLTVNGTLSYTDLTLSGNLTVDGRIIGSTGRTADFVVSANDAPQWWKDQADYQCDGTNDEAEINCAIENCTGGGTVVLSTGTFSCRQIYLRTNIRLVGQGYNTLLKLPDHVTEAQGNENGNHGGSVIGVELSEGQIYNATVENLRVDGNKDNQDITGSWAGRYGFMCIFFDKTDYCKVLNCYIYNGWSAGIYIEPVWASAKYNQVIGNTVEDCGNSTVAFGGIYTEDAYYTLIQGNIVRNSYNHGIRAERSTFVIGNYVEGSTIGSGIYADRDHSIITNNIVRDTSDANIQLLGADYCIVSNNNCSDQIKLIRLEAGDGAEYNAIRGNTCPRIVISYESYYNIIDSNMIVGGPQHGIIIASSQNNTISNNHILGCGQLADNTYDGIHLTDGIGGIGANYNHIYGNKIRHLGGANQHRYGIYVTSTGAPQIGNIIENNDLTSSGKTDNLKNNGVNTIIKDNAGFITENFGYSTGKVNGNTISHGLSATPTIIIITPTTNTTVWITAITATTFTLGLPDGTYDIYWYAIYKP